MLISLSLTFFRRYIQCTFFFPFLGFLNAPLFSLTGIVLATGHPPPFPSRSEDIPNSRRPCDTISILFFLIAPRPCCERIADKPMPFFFFFFHKKHIYPAPLLSRPLFPFFSPLAMNYSESNLNASLLFFFFFPEDLLCQNAQL